MGKEIIMSEVRWPKATVQLIGIDGNAFSIMGAAGKAIERAYGAAAKKEYLEEAMSGDYNHLLAFTVQNTTQPEYDFDDYDEEEYEDEDEWDEEYDDPWDDESDYDDEDD